MSHNLARYFRVRECQNLRGKNAAFMAPALSIAIVATGIPPGICTVDSSASKPLSELVPIGTPITGNVVFAAIMSAGGFSDDATRLLSYLVSNCALALRLFVPFTAPISVR